MFSDMACHHDQVFDDCAYTPPFYRMLHRVSRANALVANHTQDVVGRHRKFQYKLICVELSGRKPFQIHIGLGYQIIFYFLSTSLNNPHHSPNPINHLKHPAGQNPIQNHRPRNGKDLTPNPEDLPLLVSQYRTKKFFRKVMIVQSYFNYFIYYKFYI